MNEENSNLPDPVTLANLAAQPRFVNLPDVEAIRASLEFFKRCAMAIEIQARFDSLADEKAAVQTPQQWPAPIDEFYKLIVRAKDRTTNQPRLKAYLLHIWQELARLKPKALNPSEADRQAEAHLLALKSNGFSREEWHEHAAPYLAWWKKQKTEKKQLAGKLGQAALTEKRAAEQKAEEEPKKKRRKGA